MAPVDRDGFWSPRTATIDWCEENYVITPYIAEFWNTVSNLVMIIPPLLGGISAVKQNMEMRLSACHFSILVVGIGSWLFHMTLLYSMQLLDELPMVWGSASLLYALFNMELLSKRANKIVQIGLVLYCSAVTAMYLLNKNAVFHEIAYGLMVGLMVLIGWRCLYRHRDKVLWRFHVASLVTYNIGFVLWLVDNNTCSVLRNLRSEYLGWASPVSQLHAWWHILAGLGTYLGVTFTIHTSYLMAKKKPDIKWLLGVWPYVTVEGGNKHD